jgi:hypothetical protein
VASTSSPLNALRFSGRLGRRGGRAAIF